MLIVNYLMHPRKLRIFMSKVILSVCGIFNVCTCIYAQIMQSSFVQSRFYPHIHIAKYLSIVWNQFTA